jgi:flagellar biosynthesis component FlhA
VAFQSFVVLVFIWLGDGSRLNKSCLHDLGVPYHHCYRVSSPLLVEFISFWYQSFGSKISFVYLLFFIQFSVPCCVKNKKKQKKQKTKKTKKTKKKKKKEKKVQNSSKKKKSAFQSCFSKKIAIVPERKKKKKLLHFNLVSARK